MTSGEERALTALTSSGIAHTVTRYELGHPHGIAGIAPDPVRILEFGGQLRPGALLATRER